MRRLLITALLLALPGSAFAYSHARKAEVVGGAGFGNYTKDLGAVTGTGFAWNGRFGYQFQPAAGLELGYQGLNSNFSNIVLPNGVFSGNFDVLQSTISLNARVGAPIPISDSQLYLYGIVGAGYSNIFMQQGGFLVGDDTDNAFLVPVGGGASFIFPGGLMIDSRFTYNFLTGDRSPLIQTGDSWILGFNLGARFGTGI